jgi:hypothetical protein
MFLFLLAPLAMAAGGGLSSKLARQREQYVLLHRRERIGH